LLFWMSLGLLCWYEGRRRSNHWLVFCAGIAAGISYLSKQTGAVLLIFYGVETLWRKITTNPVASGRKSQTPPRKGTGSANKSPITPAHPPYLWRAMVLAIVAFIFVQALVLVYFARYQAVSLYLE